MRGKALKNYGTVAAGIVVGGVNGVIVAKFGILSFITTLGMGTVLDGVIYGLTGGTTVFNGIPKSFTIPGILKIAGIPFITIVAVVLYLVFHIFMNHMAAGRKLYAIGGSEEAAKVAGIRIFRYRVLAFTLCAALAGLIGCEAAGRGVNTAETAATIATGRLGIFHGMKSYFCQDEYGQIAPLYSISAGLDYPGIGPEHANLYDTGRARYVAITDDEAVDAFEYLSRIEGIIPVIESAHAIAYAMKLAPTMGKDKIIVVNVSGRGDKDCAAIARYRGEDIHE